MLYLKKANMEDAMKEYDLISRIPADENGLTNPDAGCSLEDFTAQVLPRILRYEKGKDLPDGWVPETQFFLWDEEEIIGLFRLRHYLNDDLRNYHGHVGYWIRGDCRGRGYASAGLAMLIKEAEEIIREDELNYYTRIKLNKRLET